jgi:L-threonylcarbamoyladenylate synthase
MKTIKEAIVALKSGEVIAYPTEAVFGVGCDPDNEAAVMSLLALKERPIEKGLILIAANMDQLANYVDLSQLSDAQISMIEMSWPGPVTWVMPKKEGVLPCVTGQFDTLAVRVSDHPLVQTLCRDFGKPITSTSANLSGLPPCRTDKEVQIQLGDRLNTIVGGNTGGRLNPSEIRDAQTGHIFRQG